VTEAKQDIRWAPQQIAGWLPDTGAMVRACESLQLRERLDLAAYKVDDLAIAEGGSAPDC